MGILLHNCEDIGMNAAVQHYSGKPPLLIELAGNAVRAELDGSGGVTAGQKAKGQRSLSVQWFAEHFGSYLSSADRFRCPA